MLRRLMCILRLKPHVWEWRDICSIYIEGNSRDGTTLIDDFRKHKYEVCKYCHKIKES